MTVTGDIASEGPLRLEGRIEGNVRCDYFSQGQSGVLAGDVVAREIQISGSVEGSVTGQMVTIEASGRVTGDIA
jgi:cytoskeletal protein CcmA (bactofilin family)